MVRVDTAVVHLSANEQRVLDLLGQKDAVDPVDCAHLAELRLGMADAALKSLASKGLAAPNSARKGLRKRADGTWSITDAGRNHLSA